MVKAQTLQPDCLGCNLDLTSGKGHNLLLCSWFPIKCEDKYSPHVILMRMNYFMCATCCEDKISLTYVPGT